MDDYEHKQAFGPVEKEKSHLHFRTHLQYDIRGNNIHIFSCVSSSNNLSNRSHEIPILPVPSHMQQEDENLDIHDSIKKMTGKSLEQSIMLLTSGESSDRTREAVGGNCGTKREKLKVSDKERKKKGGHPHTQYKGRNKVKPTPTWRKRSAKSLRV